MFKTIRHIFNSHYCKTVYLLALIGGYLLTPKSLFKGWLALLAIIFIMVFALSLTCIVRNIKERVKLAVTYKNSWISIIASAIGILALQVCTTSGFYCGASVLSGIMAIFIPNLVLVVLEDFSVVIIIASLLFQLYALYKMKCLGNIKIMI